MPKITIIGPLTKTQLAELIPSGYGNHKHKEVERNGKKNRRVGIDRKTLREYALLALRNHPDPLAGEYYIYWDRKNLIPKKICEIILLHHGFDT